jgi:hypothetical protein
MLRNVLFCTLPFCPKPSLTYPQHGYILIPKNASQTNIVRTIEDNKISPDFSIELKAIYKRVEERNTKYGELSND